MKQFLFTCLMFCSIILHAQFEKNEIQVIQGVYGIEKKKIMMQAMQMSSTDENKFWAIYEKYELQRSQLSTDRLQIVSDYITNYQRLDEELAHQIASRCFKNDEQTEALHRQYYKIVKREISALKAAQFMQIEIYLQNVVRIQVQNQIPFIGEIIPVINQNPVPISNNP